MSLCTDETPPKDAQTQSVGGKDTAATMRETPRMNAQTHSAPPFDSPYAVMSVSSYVVATVLMSIPLIGCLFCVIWACGGCRNYNKRNFARAVLVLTVLSVLFSVVMCMSLYFLATAIFSTFSQHTNFDFSNIQEIINSLKQLNIGK